MPRMFHGRGTRYRSITSPTWRACSGDSERPAPYSAGHVGVAYPASPSADQPVFDVEPGPQRVEALVVAGIDGFDPTRRQVLAQPLERRLPGSCSDVDSAKLVAMASMVPVASAFG